jgi:serine/threonine protein kinase
MNYVDAVTIISKTILPSRDLQALELEDTLMSEETLISTMHTLADQAAEQANHSVNRNQESTAIEGLSLSLNRDSILIRPQAKEDASLKSNRYMGQKKLGEGNFGIVWEAVDQDIGRNVAIKTFKFDAEQGKRALMEEIKVAGHLEHPGIPPIYDIGLDCEGRYYFIMKYLQGEPLSDIINKLRNGDPQTHERFPFERRVDLIIQLLRIIKASHQAQMLHRDIKPDNMIIGPSDELMLIDWGIALNLKESNGEGTISGTPLYMAPEQAMMKGLSEQSDLYSVGAVFYELMTLQVPIPLQGVKSLHEVIEKIVKHIPVSPDTIAHPHQSFMPVQYREVINKAIQKNPLDRFANADDMLKELKESNQGHINVVCMRTKMVRDTNALMRWVDQNPVKHMMTLVAVLISMVIFLLACGAALGYFAIKYMG